MFFEKAGSQHIGRFRELFRSRQVIHGFSTRVGGVSQAPYDTLNLGHNTADDPDLVAENRNRFFQALGLSLTQAVIPDQVHGVHVLHVKAPGFYPETDAVVTDTPGLALTIQTADCVPICLVDSTRPAVGLVHAGWKGSVQAIAHKAIRLMHEAFGSRAEKMDAFLGPSIGPCCYEVGVDVTGQFDPIYLEGTRLNLWQYNFDLLVKSGVGRDRIYVARICTKCHSDRFFSHRAGGGKTGRMMAVLAIQK